MDLISFHIHLCKQYTTTVKTSVRKIACLGHQLRKWQQFKKQNSCWKTEETAYFLPSVLKKKKKTNFSTKRRYAHILSHRTPIRLSHFDKFEWSFCQSASKSELKINVTEWCQIAGHCNFATNPTNLQVFRLSHWWSWRACSTEVCCCVNGWLPSNISGQYSGLVSLNPWKWDHYAILKNWAPITQQHRLISQRKGDLHKLAPAPYPCTNACST